MKPSRPSALCLFQPSAFSLQAFRLSGFSLILALSAFHPFGLSVFSQAPTPATVTGRVFNVATGYYLKNAEVRLEGTSNIVYTEDGGHYTITVPAGKVTLTASYANTQTATLAIDATPGAPNVFDFELQPLVIGTRVTGTSADAEVIVLDRFEVTAERSGQARAIMTQRAAINAVTSIATDNFGNLTQDSIGEFLKYMPGITLDYEEDEATAVRVGGLDPKYAGFTIDGIELASGHESSSRGNFFQQLSITGIESIEFHQTLLARMPASTPAGKFEMKSRYAFDRRRPQLRFVLGLDGVSDAIESGRSYMPDDKKHYRTYPGGSISWGGPFFNRRLGIDISLSRFANYRNNPWNRMIYHYMVPDNDVNPGYNFVEKNGNLELAEGPFIRALSWGDRPRIETRNSANFSLDYKITPNLTFSLRSNYTYRENEVYQILLQLNAFESTSASSNYMGPLITLHPESSITRWMVAPMSATQYPVVNTFNSYRYEQFNNYSISPRLEYKKGPLQINLRGARSYSRADYKDAEKGTFRNSSNRIQGIGWIAERSSPNSPTWTLTQTEGTPWSEPENWSRTVATANSIYNSSPHVVKNTKDSGFLDITLAVPVLGHPVTFMTGGGINKNTFSRRLNDDRYTFIGPDGRALQSFIPYTENYIFKIDLGSKSGNINEQGWRVDDQRTLWQLYQEHPDWFVPDTVNNFRRGFLNQNNLKEDICSAYFEATTRAGRFAFNLGARFEKTHTEILTVRMRSWEDIDAAIAIASPDLLASGIFDYTTDSNGIRSFVNNEGFLYQYYDGRRFPRATNYQNFFFSGGIKYDIAKNLQFQLAASQSILRPDYWLLAGNMQYNTSYAREMWVPNPGLKPEKTTKIFARIQWFLNPAGVLALSAYRLDIRGLQVKDKQIDIEQAESLLGFPLRYAIATGGDDGFIDDFEDDGTMDPRARYYRTTLNAEGTRTIYGATVEYNQQLTFLPGVLKGLGIFGSATVDSIKNAEEDEEKIGRAGKAASGGIRYRYDRFNIELRATWKDDSLASVNRPIPGQTWFANDHIYLKARTIVDLSGDFRLNRNLTLSFSIRNLTNSPTIRYSNVPERLNDYYIHGATWNLSLKGTF